MSDEETDVDGEVDAVVLTDDRSVVVPEVVAVVDSERLALLLTVVDPELVPEFDTVDDDADSDADAETVVDADTA
jgi:hypothetical protein